MAVGARSFLLGGLAGVGGQIGLTRWSHVSRMTEMGPSAGRAPVKLHEGDLWAVTFGITIGGRTSR